MTHTRLLTAHGDYVTTVVVPPFSPAVEVINWGTRFFVRQANGEYREGIVWCAVEEALAG